MDPAGEELIQPRFVAPRAPAAIADASSTLGLGLPGGSVFNTLKKDYFEIIDNPKRLPFFFHPFFGREKEFSIIGDRTYFTQTLILNDHLKVPRKLYFNFDAEHLTIGATGGLLIGLATNQYFASHGLLAMMGAQKWMKNVEAGNASNLERFAYASTVTWRVAKRAAVGALLFDMVKRNADIEFGDEKWLNSTLAGAVCGGLFGLRGGYHTGILGTFGFGLFATLYQITKHS